MTDVKILAIDDDPRSLDLTLSAMQQDGIQWYSSNHPQEGLELFRRHQPEVVLLDMMLPDLDGIEVLRQIVELGRDGNHSGVPTIVIMLTACATPASAVAAMKAGAYDYVTKPIRIAELRSVVDRAVQRVRLQTEINSLRRTLDSKYGFESILGDSKPLLKVLNLAARAAQTDTTVLIRGETGTGKELLARAIHFNSRRKNSPFVTINCGAIPKDLLESELFGHLKGSFTGAITHKSGKVEAAHQGTLFLDEIGDLPLDLQVKLLRLVQQGEIEKIGANEPVKVDVRIIAATHRSLQAMMEDQTFREDLYYRLAVIPLELPPLRERRDDIPELLRFFFQKACEKHGRTDLQLPETLMHHFVGHSWPGNVRELENVVESLVVLADGGLICPSDLPDALLAGKSERNLLQLKLPPDKLDLEGVEKELILLALHKFDWNQSRAARYLDISRKTLIYRMEKFGLRQQHSH